jgi:Mlc titration factor MtfA (ptsG expression regulator)
VDRRVALWRHLDDAERAEAEATTSWLLDKARWEAARGFTLTDDVPLTIAAQAALLVLGLGPPAYRIVSAVVVHPSTVTLHGPRAGPAPGTVTDGPLPVLGQASDERGPVLIAWDAALEGAAHPERGLNVVHHEFAHKVDMLDGYADGVPPLAGNEARQRWHAVCDPVHLGLRAGRPHPVLRPYGGVDMAEFFAVASEAFLNRPLDLLEHEPQLYAVLVDAYAQDPAARARGGGAAAG